MQKTGVTYKGAGGETFKNLGEKVLKCRTHQGKEGRMTAQVCATTKPLYSISQCVHAGHKVAFAEGEKGSYIENQTTKDRQYLHEKNGTYELVLDVATYPF